MLARVSLFLLGGVILSLFAPWCLANNVLLVAILHSEIEITTFFVIIVSFLRNENYDSKDHLLLMIIPMSRVEVEVSSLQSIDELLKLEQP